MYTSLDKYSAWDSSNPLYFGCGSSKLTGLRFKEMGCKKVLAVYDMGIKKVGIVDPILNTLTENGIEYICYEGVLADPPDTSVEECAQMGKDNKIDGILAIGGGSSMDTAKGARVLMTNDSPINQYFMGPGGKAINTFGMTPIIVIPTTSGTGSEASPGAVISDTTTGLKRAVNVGVSLGIIDPELTVGLPPGLTASTGIDAFTHAAESLITKYPNALAAVLAKFSVSAVTKWLPVAVNDPNNLKARIELSKASSLATAGMRGPLGSLPHGFGKGLTIMYHTPHGITVGLFTAANFKKQALYIPEQVAEVCEAMGAEVPEGATP
ncbi:MAG: alcohol dehydrogenase, class, partial [Sedimentibacter sp.]|nr:alcohol dehydrogenase, class [Sedimentibacter sp.]